MVSRTPPTKQPCATSTGVARPTPVSRRRLIFLAGAVVLILRAALWFQASRPPAPEPVTHRVPEPVARPPDPKPVTPRAPEPVAPSPKPEPRPDLENARKLVVERLEVALQQATGGDKAAIKRFQSALDQVAQHHFADALGRVDLVLDETLSFKNCSTLTWLEVKDKFADTSEAAEYWQSRTIERLTPPCQAACAALEHAILEFQDDLARGTTDYHIALAQTLDQAEHTCPDLAPRMDDLVADVAATFPQFTEITRITATVPVSLALDAAFELSPLVLGGRLGSTGAQSLAGSWLPLADGPFPLFDVAWGALALTLAARDVAAWNRARGPKRKELRNALNRAVETFRQRAIGEVETRRSQILKVHQATRMKQARKILEGLGVPEQSWPPDCRRGQG